MISEELIRPKNLDNGKSKAIAEDVNWLLDRLEEFVNVNCPACGKNSSKPAFEKFGFSFVGCASCRTVYMNPRASDATLSEFYSRSKVYKYWDEFVFPATRATRKEKIFKPRVMRILELLTELNVSPGVLIDVGAAGGMFCEEALKSSDFPRVLAIEPNEAQAESCRKNGIEVIEATLENSASLGVKANVLCSFETIEHVYSPRDFLAACHDLLEAEGLLVLTCPNFEGFDISVLGADSDSLDAEHINMFNPDSLGLLLRSVGFDVVELKTPGELDADLVRQKQKDTGGYLANDPFLHKVLIEEWDRYGEAFQEFLQKSLASSHMWVVAQKPR